MNLRNLLGVAFVFILLALGGVQSQAAPLLGNSSLRERFVDGRKYITYTLKPKPGTDRVLGRIGREYVLLVEPAGRVTLLNTKYGELLKQYSISLPTGSSVTGLSLYEGDETAALSYTRNFAGLKVQGAIVWSIFSEKRIYEDENLLDGEVGPSVFSSDLKFVIGASKKEIIQKELKMGGEVRRFAFSEDPVQCFASPTDGNKIYFATAKGSIYEIDSGLTKANLITSSLLRSAEALSVSLDHKVVVAQNWGFSPLTYVFDLEKGEPIRVMHMQNRSVVGLNHIYSVTNTETVSWSIKDGGIFLALPHPKPLKGLDRFAFDFTDDFSYGAAFRLKQNAFGFPVIKATWWNLKKPIEGEFLGLSENPSPEYTGAEGNAHLKSTNPFDLLPDSFFEAASEQDPTSPFSIIEDEADLINLL